MDGSAAGKGHHWAEHEPAVQGHSAVVEWGLQGAQKLEWCTSERALSFLTERK